MVCLSCTTLALIGAICWLLYWVMTWSFGYWKKRGIKEAKAYPLVGSFPSAFTQKQHMADDIEAIYRKYRSSENFVGVFTAMKPQLLVLDPALVHKIYVNDFKNFHDNEFSEFVDEKVDVIFANNPFTTKGERWKERRNEITPGLTAVRIKNAYPVTLQVCNRFKNYINEQLKAPSKDGIDTMDLVLRYTCEVTTDCVLGVSANSLGGQSTQILENTKSIFEASFKLIFYQFVVGFMPGLEKLYKMRFFPKPAEDFFTEVMRQAIELRRNNRNDRVDFLNYMLELSEKKHFSTRDMTAHTMTFLTDGFFTTAMSVSHCLLLLARFPETQEKLREEIMENLDKNGTIEYEKLHQMPYMDACFHESLRLFSPLLFANKLCTAPYECENKDGTKLSLKPGDVVIIPVNSLHLDEKYFEKPLEFMPERFMGEDSVKSYREKGLFYGFGDGPRVCLGMRFALTQVKAGLVEIIKNFKVTVNPKTRTDNRLDPKQFIAMLDGGIFLNFEPLN